MDWLSQYWPYLLAGVLLLILAARVAIMLPMFRQVPTRHSGARRIRVIGVGGGGGNAVNHMIREKQGGVDYVAVNTDAQVLDDSMAPERLQIGQQLTQGLGAGGDATIGREAAIEDAAAIDQMLAGTDLVFIAAGLGGGTGSGAAPVIAAQARKAGALTVGVVTKPFAFEGVGRQRVAETAAAELKANVDTLMLIENERIMGMIGEDTPMLDAFSAVNEVLARTVRAVVDVMTVPGLINLDFADVKTIMRDGGMATTGIGWANGPDRAVEAARAAVVNPLLDHDIAGAAAILLNVAGASGMTMREVTRAAEVIRDAADPDAMIIFGTIFDDQLKDDLRVTVIATKFGDRPATPQSQPAVEQAMAADGSAEDGAVAEPAGAGAVVAGMTVMAATESMAMPAEDGASPDESMAMPAEAVTTPESMATSELMINAPSVASQDAIGAGAETAVPDLEATDAALHEAAEHEMTGPEGVPALDVDTERLDLAALVRETTATSAMKAEEEPLAEMGAEEAPLAAVEADEETLEALQADEAPLDAISAMETDDQPLAEMGAEEAPLAALEADETPVEAVAAMDADDQPLTAMAAEVAPITVMEAEEEPVEALAVTEAAEEPLSVMNADEAKVAEFDTAWPGADPGPSPLAEVDEPAAAELELEAEPGLPAFGAVAAETPMSADVDAEEPAPTPLFGEEAPADVESQADEPAAALADGQEPAFGAIAEEPSPADAGAEEPPFGEAAEEPAFGPIAQEPAFEEPEAPQPSFAAMAEEPSGTDGGADIAAFGPFDADEAAAADTVTEEPAPSEPAARWSMFGDKPSPAVAIAAIEPQAEEVEASPTDGLVDEEPAAAAAFSGIDADVGESTPQTAGDEVGDETGEDEIAPAAFVVDGAEDTDDGAGAFQGAPASYESTSTPYESTSSAADRLAHLGFDRFDSTAVDVPPEQPAEAPSAGWGSAYDQPEPDASSSSPGFEYEPASDVSEPRDDALEPHDAAPVAAEDGSESAVSGQESPPTAAPAEETPEAPASPEPYRPYASALFRYDTSPGPSAQSDEEPVVPEPFEPPVVPEPFEPPAASDPFRDGDTARFQSAATIPDVLHDAPAPEPMDLPTPRDDEHGERSEASQGQAQASASPSSPSEASRRPPARTPLMARFWSRILK